ncbi:phage baseplate assembly protein V [Crenobacter luteus]|uniref:phage baseplate assembly protein V n=1 Tax=Crenobacter luteus TaxID=1452487 RepID=UPI00104B377D|nr:phage baseplate assembly protein V [Crenobacter luteus]TCP13769.1 phage baseplate assembly protein V [Crenobacter luteus]
MDQLADLIRRIESLIRYGTIAEVQMTPPRVRVQSGGLTSDWRPWFAPRAGTTIEWDPPTIGEQCMLFSPSGDPATAVVLVGLFSDAHPAPSSSPDEHLRTYPDGARILYNHATGALEATGIKTALVQAAEKCIVDCPESEFTGNVLVRGTLTYLGGLNNAGMGTGATISGPIDHDGDYQHQGTFNNTGSVVSNGVTLHTHSHPGDSGGTTGAPQ